jgi:mannose-1-phosphate guanylyltransferase/mannose-6-phosphate isomerase
MRSIIPVILSGGSGTRLWPISTAASPKQFIALAGEESLLQQTVRRARAAGLVQAPILIANRGHDALLGEQLRSIDCTPARLIFEPVGRNTAPAIAMAALEAPSPDALLLVMPSDHVIADVPAFAAAIERAAPQATAGWLVTFGITPDHPETGYGYIRCGEAICQGVHQVDRFVEKPDSDRAARMIAEGGHCWNAGIFLLRADAFLEAMRLHAPAMLTAVEAALASATREGHRIDPDADAFAAIPADSIDYAVLEKAARVAVVPAAMGWSDLGSWDALHAIGSRDEADNLSEGEVKALVSRNCLFKSTGPRIAAIGVSDLIVVATGDTVLIAPRGRSQDVRRLAGQESPSATREAATAS